jgi:hypothetical protein
MKKRIIIIGLITLSCAAAISLWWFLTIRNPYQRMQENLAKELGVQIDDYPYKSVFPEGYFYTVVKPGMTMEEVHKIIKGYEKVYHCKTYSEIYYYFSVDDSKAIRLEIIYDDKGNYYDMRGDDPSGYMIKLDGCTSGLIIK